MYNDSNDYIWLRHTTTGSIYAINDSDSTLVDTAVISGNMIITDTGGDGNTKWRRAVSGIASILKATNDDKPVGIYGSAGTVGGGTAYAAYFYNGQVFITNELKFDATDGELHIPRESASAQPTPTVGELKIWRDPDDNKTYLIYNDTNEGVRKVELT